MLDQCEPKLNCSDVLQRTPLIYYYSPTGAKYRFRAGDVLLAQGCCTPREAVAHENGAVLK
jgi:hypothetical protein